MTRVVALSGGVGGARLVDGLAGAIADGTLTVIVNTGDDFSHWGLRVCPDLDTVMYTLGGLAHPTRGWGLAFETFETLAMVERYGGDAWFRLGDRDLGTHITRTDALARGERLSAVTERLCAALGITAHVLPMTDAPRPTMIDTDDGRYLTFQNWFVRERAAPAVRRVRFEGDPPPAPGVIKAIEDADVAIIGPSNPYVSIDPILSLAGVRDALAGRTVVALSPIVGGHAVKGPLGEMIPALTDERASAGAIARHYGDLLDGLMVERGDEASVDGVPVKGETTVMGDRADRVRLARAVLAFAAGL